MLCASGQCMLRLCMLHATVPSQSLCAQGSKTMELLVASCLDGDPVDVVRYAAALHPQY